MAGLGALAETATELVVVRLAKRLQGGQLAVPRQEVADGSFDESVVAADLGLVDRERGPRDYVDPVAFCEKTYLTEGLRAVIGEIASHLRGDASAAAV